MKKILSILITACLLLALCTNLVACSHECEFASEWNKDETSHWHSCTGKDCTEISKKSEHTWDEGKITSKPTQEADGVKTYTCTVCGQTRTRNIDFTGMTKSDWNAAFEDSVFENFAYSEVAEVTGSGVTVSTHTDYKFTEDNAWAKMVIAEQSQESYAPDTAAANELREQLVKSIKDMTAYENFSYNRQTKTYKANKNIAIAALGSSTSDIYLKFADGRLIEIKYTVSFKQQGITFDASSTVTLYDYGTVVLTPNE